MQIEEDITCTRFYGKIIKKKKKTETKRWREKK